MKFIEGVLLLVVGAIMLLVVANCAYMFHTARHEIKYDYVARVAGVTKAGVPSAVSNATAKVKSRNFLPVMLSVTESNEARGVYDVACGGVDASEFGAPKAAEDEAR